MDTYFNQIFIDGLHIGKTDDLIKNKDTYVDAINKLKSIPFTEENYSCRYQVIDTVSHNDLLKLSQIEERDALVKENNLTVFQKWFTINHSYQIDLLKSYFREEIKDMILKLYPDLNDDMELSDTFTLYTDGDFILPHADGENVGRRCVIIIYLSNELDYNNGGGNFVGYQDNKEIHVIPTNDNFVILDFTKGNPEHWVTPVKNGFKRYSYICFVNKKIR
jgi:Rps23 Pro-64 3,4-dihydroxylase Tpa1-like proline 4-hydroxylase